MQLNDQIVTITEGKTQILIPQDSLKNKVPPRDPAFFNPRAKLSRDLSIIAYSAFLKNFEGPKTFLDGLSGLGARGLRVANEIGIQVFVNDLNPSALELSKKSAALNNLENYQVSENEICRFLSSFSEKGRRGAIVDVDPFGSPVKHIDCAIRATIHKGLLSVTATDLQVLHGLFKDACKKKYYGTPIKTTYSNEISIRLILGCINIIAARLDAEITPIFVENNQHYYRVYVRILNKPDTRNTIGFIAHCRTCGSRGATREPPLSCELCGSKVEVAGPLWIGQLFEKGFVESMQSETPNFSVDKKCEKIIQKCVLESNMPVCYYTLDEIAEMNKSSPISLEESIKRLQENGFVSSPTSFNPTGFRTDCKISKIRELLAR
ncbi:tRNA (guanine-N1)-methyltransferase [Candidatus Parcubacteria bacterium]|nr:MAG: tRNA (guanine-N1)-methyltransferase [Candidatus Parcubacteria bacterium]